MKRNVAASNALLEVLHALGRTTLFERAREFVSLLADEFQCARQRDRMPHVEAMSDTESQTSALDEPAPLDEPVTVRQGPSLEVAIRTEIRAALEAKMQRPLRAGEEELSFSALGLDSITLLELAAKLEERYEVSLTDFAAYEHPTLSALSAHVTALLSSRGARSTSDIPRPSTHVDAARSAAEHSFELPLWPAREGN